LRVVIGRIEVVPVAAEAPARPVGEAPRPKLGLADYLRRRGAR
jgi:hypothetical protein